MDRVHGPKCRCWECRHARFNPGPATITKRQRRNRAHVEALAEDRQRFPPKRQTILGGVE